MVGFFRTISMVSACVFLCFGISFAVEDVANSSVELQSVEEPVSLETEVDGKQIVLNMTVTPPSVSVTTEPSVVNVEAPVVNVEAPALTSSESLDSSGSAEVVPAFSSSSTFSLDSSGTDSGSTIRSVLENLLGVYTPRTQTVTEHLEDGTEVSYQQYVPGLAGVDWTWLSALFIFSLMLYCLFRLLGGVMSRG